MDHNELREASRDRIDLLMAQNNALKAGEGALASLCDRQSVRIAELERALGEVLQNANAWAPGAVSFAHWLKVEDVKRWRAVLRG